MTESEFLALDRRLLGVADRSVSYSAAAARELQQLVADARESIAEPGRTLARANALVTAVEARSLALAVGATVSTSTSSGTRPAASSSTSSGASTDTAASSGALVPAARTPALGALGGAGGVAAWWGGLPTVTKTAVVVGAGALVVWAYRRWAR